MDEQEFRLCFIEGFEEGERLCTPKAKVALGDSGEFGIRVAVKPPIDASRWTHYPCESLVLIARFAGTSLFPIREGSTHVRVFVPVVDQAELRDRFERDELYMIAFGSVRPDTS